MSHRCRRTLRDWQRHTLRRHALGHCGRRALRPCWRHTLRPCGRRRLSIRWSASPFLHRHVELLRHVLQRHVHDPRVTAIRLRAGLLRRVGRRRSQGGSRHLRQRHCGDAACQCKSSTARHEVSIQSAYICEHSESPSVRTGRRALMPPAGWGRGKSAAPLAFLWATSADLAILAPKGKDSVNRTRQYRGRLCRWSAPG